MKIAVMSDVHSNPTALRTALTDARAQGCERFVFLGDVTGYGYDVRTSLRLVRESFDVALLGNHDSALLGHENPVIMQLCSNYAVDVRQRSELSADDKAWLNESPFFHREAGAVFVHGDLTDPPAWNYIMSEDHVQANFAVCDETFIFCGHTHHVQVWERLADGRVARPKNERLEIPAGTARSLSWTCPAGSRLLVNVGSVGNPRNDFCLSYAIFDPDAREVTLRQLPFDFADYVIGLTRAGIELPDWLRDLMRRLLNCADPDSLVNDFIPDL